MRSKGSLAGRLGSFGGALALLVSTAAAQALPPHPGNSWIVAHNRGLAFGVAGSLQGGIYPSHGIYPVNEGTQLAIRFTMPAAATVQAVRLNAFRKGDPGNLQVVLYPNDPATDQPDETAPLDMAEYQAVTGWQSIALPQAPSLAQGGVYHLLIRAASGPFSSAHSVAYLTTLSRFPVPFQAGQPSAADERRSFYDPKLALMSRTLTPPGFFTPWHVENMFDGINPLFALEGPSGSLLGWPYDDHQEPVITSTAWYGQAFELDPGESIEFDYVAMFTRGRKNSQTDKLFLDVYDATAGSVLATAVLIDPAGVTSLTTGRSHWFGVRFPAPLLIAAAGSPRTFYLVLRAEPLMVRTGHGYVFARERSTIDGDPSTLPTYRRARSYAVASGDSGASYTALPDSDTPFILAKLSGSHPIGFYDEGEFENALGHDTRTAQAGEVITMGLTMRNVGPVTGDI